MRTRYKVYEKQKPHFITLTTVEWIPVFIEAKYFDILIDSFMFCRENKDLKIHAYVIMLNHLHAILSSPSLPDLMRDFKAHTAKAIIEAIKAEDKTWLINQLRFFNRRGDKGSVHQLWQEGYHPEEIISREMFLQKAEYIHVNPVRKGLVEEPEAWRYSSAGNYVNGKGVIGIDML
ncbi:MAG: REP-associated tyrosine transposase [bacterium]